jgi:hypothetical protein
VGRRGDRIYLAQGRQKRQAHVKTTMILQIPYNAESVLPSSRTVRNRETVKITRLQRDGQLAPMDEARK